jgi:C1A family cysteine protease
VAPWFLRWLFHVDWRDRFGLQAVPPVRDQGACGSCVAFAAVAVLESMLVIERNHASDLSEAELLFCGGGGCDGWWPDHAIDYAGDRGIAQESCFPYQAHDMPCPRRDGEAIKITRTTTLFDVEQRKDYLAFVGPMMCAFVVHSDFYGYSSGVYSHVTGEALGGHCVEVVGYDDFLGCWICKNSWGSGWGDGGFFQIAYGQCEIDSTYPFWGMSGTEWWS